MMSRTLTRRLTAVLSAVTVTLGAADVASADMARRALPCVGNGEGWEVYEFSPWNPLNGLEGCGDYMSAAAMCERITGCYELVADASCSTDENGISSLTCTFVYDPGDDE